MIEVEFFPLDVDYVTSSTGRAVIRLFGRTADGKRVCLYDDLFEPYFYVLPDKVEHTKELVDKLLLIKVKEPDRIAYVTRTELHKKVFLGKDIEVIKVFTNHPKDVPVLKEEASFFEHAAGCFETDIPFYRRYLIDKNITPLTLYVAKGKEIEDSIRADITLKAESIEPKDGQFIKNPKILAFDIECSSKRKMPDPSKDPIVMIAFYGNDGYSKVITWKKFDNPKKHIEFVPDEASMIMIFRDTIQEYQPDYLVGYYSDGFDFPYLQDRARKFNIKLTLGVDNSNVKFSRGRNAQKAKITGIMHIDLLKFLNRVMRELFVMQEYDLDSVAKKLLGEGKKEIDISTLFQAWESEDQERLKEFCEYNLQDAKIAHRLANIMMPHLHEFVKILGLPLDDCSRMSFGQIVEWYLIRRIKDFNEIVPNKPDYKEASMREMQSYEGGFVFEPQAGLYKDVMVFDFKSLYPTIITAHNICVSTLTQDQQDAYISPSIILNGENIHYCFTHKREGFIPVILKDILTRRNRIKDIMAKDQKKDPVLNARQYSLKILANSFYGYFGFSRARWYSKECAAAITAYGRDYIHKVIDKAQQEKFGIIYSDTDSVFLTLGTKSKKEALDFLKAVNRELPSLMELEYENFYPRGIFVMKKGGTKGAKKKYALIDEDGEIKVTGFETVRGDWSLIAKEVQERVLEIILREQNINKAFSYAKEIIKKIEKKEIPFEKMVIQKQMKKNIGEYENVGPHVEVAKRLQQRGETIEAGTIIKYIINEGRGIIRERAKPVDETKSYDSEYYIHHQIIPAIIQIFDVLGYTKEDFLGKTQSTLGDFS